MCFRNTALGLTIASMLPIKTSGAQRAAAQTPASRATAAEAAMHVMKGIPITGVLQAAISEALEKDFGQSQLRWVSGNRYRIADCGDVEVTAQLIDLNRDDTPEVDIETTGDCAGPQGSALSALWVYDKAAKKYRNVVASVAAGFVPLRSRTNGFTDIISSGPGMTSGVWRYDGSRYRHFCTQGKRGTPGVNCPTSVSQWEAGATFAAFPGKRR